MKSIFKLLALLLVITLVLQACNSATDDDDDITNNTPTLVSKDAKKKIAILEEFTGVRCGWCPQGHEVIKNVLDAYPDQVFAISYHPSNSSLTEPYDGYPDLRREIVNPIYTNDFAGKSLFMPGAFIVRRKGMDSSRLQGRNVWQAACGGVITEDSPFNVGFKSSLDLQNKLLKVTVQLYFTQEVTHKLYLYVMLVENGIITKQAGATGDYTQNHVFREILNANNIWGNLISEPTTSGSLVTKNITYDFSANLYTMTNCDILVFVRDGATEEIITGNGAAVGAASPM